MATQRWAGVVTELSVVVVGEEGVKGIRLWQGAVVL